MPIPTTSQQMGNPLYARLEGAYASGNATTPYSPSSASNGVYRVGTGTSTSKPNFISPDGSTLYDSLGRPYKSEATQAYEASQSAQPSQNPSKPNAQSLAQTTPPKPQSLGTQIGGALLAVPVYFAGDFAGDRLSEATWGTSNGIGSQIGSFVGATVGGITGAALAGVPSLGVGGVAGGLIGTGFGAAVGSFIGGFFDTLGGLIFGSNKASPAPDRGKGYQNPANLPTPEGLSNTQAGVAYRALFRTQNAAGAVEESIQVVTGSFGGVVGAGTNNQGYIHNISPLNPSGTLVMGVLENQPTTILTIVILGRLDGGVDPTYNESPNANKPFVPNNAGAGAGFDGSPFDALSDGEKYQERTGKREPPVLPDATKPDPTKPRQVAPSSPDSSPSPSPLNGSNPAYDGNKPLASSPSPSNSSSSSAEKQSRPNNGFSSTGMQPAFESKPFVAGTSNPNDYGKEIDNITGKERVTSPVVDPLKATPVVTPTPKPNTPNAPATDNYDTAKILLGIGALAGTVTALKVGSDLLVNNSLSNTPKIDQIAQNTTNTNQQTNAKQGVCDAMQPSQCGFEGVKQATAEATEPIKDQTVANAGAISAIASLLNTIWEFMQNRIGKILQILNNTVVDRTLAVMNLVTNIHNAALLTRDIGETLGSVVDNVIGLTGLRFTNSEGSQVGFTDVIGSNFRGFLIQVLGAERYVELTLNWQKASMILNSAAQVLNTTQSMLDPISSAVEYGMENVSKIGNSLKEDGVVSENAYPAMDETIRARRVNRFERLNDTLEGAENIASNLSNVTSSAVSIKEDYKQLREDAKDLKDKATAFNTADSEARAALKAELPTEITPITLAPAPAEDEEP